MVRKIIQINEELCNGCGLCAAACHEGAIGMVEGKARLLRADYCDGLGAVSYTHLDVYKRQVLRLNSGNSLEKQGNTIFYERRILYSFPAKRAA